MSSSVQVLAQQIRGVGSLFSENVGVQNLGKHADVILKHAYRNILLFPNIPLDMY